jgi:protein-S-isoprenylcysteine O-methyltransferase Ste14
MADQLRTILSPSIYPLIKVPFILVAMIGLQVAVTPPHPPPTKDEEAESTKLEAAIKQRSAPVLVKVRSSLIFHFVRHESLIELQAISWGAALSEIAVILAQSAPLLPISKHILSNLVLSDGAADRVRPSPLFFVGACLAATGGLIRYKCYKALGCMFTYEMSILRNHALVTTGPYSIVRHPGYSGLLVTMIGMLMLHGSKVNISVNFTLT